MICCLERGGEARIEVGEGGDPGAGGLKSAYSFMQCTHAFDPTHHACFAKYGMGEPWNPAYVPLYVIRLRLVIVSC